MRSKIQIIISLLFFIAISKNNSFFSQPQIFILIFNCCWWDRFIPSALTHLDLLYFLCCTLQPSPSFSGDDASRMELNGAEREGDLNLWCLLLPLLFLRHLFLFFCTLRKIFSGFIFSGSSRVWNSSRNEATLKIAKTLGHFSLPVDQVRESISPKATAAACRSVFPSLPEDISIQCAECCVKREMVSWGRSVKVRLIRDDLTPGMRSHPNCSCLLFFFPTSPAVWMFGCQEMLGNLHIWRLMWS